MRRFGNGFFVVVGLLLAASSSALASRELRLEERVAAQRALEQVLWRHRIWPAENPGSKPTLDEVLPEDAIRARVEDYLRKSNALERHWGEALTARRLQAEIDRMVRDTRQAEVLRELFAALDDDPFLIAECLARPQLAERLIRNWYARDTRFHGETRRRAERAIGRGATLAGMKTLGGSYAEQSWRLDEGQAGRRILGSEPGVGRVASREEWERLLADLGRRLPHAPPSGLYARDAAAVGSSGPVVGVPGPLTEDDDAFTITALVARASDRLDIAVVRWPKVTFDRWWSRQGPAESTALAAPPATYRVSALTAAACPADSWAPIGGALPDPLAWHTAVWTGTEMIVWGGNSTLPSNAGFRYNPATDTWQSTGTGANLPSPRFWHTAIWTGTEMIVWGGFQLSFDAMWQALDDGGRYDPVTNAWVPVGGAAWRPAGRGAHEAVWTGSEMIVWGGQADSANTFLNTGGAYDPANSSWTATGIGAGTPTPRVRHTMIWNGSHVIVWGGQSVSGLENTGGRYDPTTHAWTATSTPGICSADPSFLCNPGDCAAMGSGTCLGVSGLTPRADHTAVASGSSMIVWGGVDASLQELNTGGQYDPVSDRWTATNPTTAPSPRSDHTAVWTGQKMIVWGGADTSAGALNDGGIYDPFSNTWQPTSLTASTPSPRALHTAVWTGTAMIVWGGRNTGSPAMRSGGRFNPSTGAWTPTAIGTMLPDPRFGHTAVATGAEMIVWGGAFASSAATNSGGRYRPSTDSWTPTSEVGNVPLARSGHTAVWTGRHVIVWGGTQPASGLLNSGARYNPVTDSWLPTNVLAPAPRRLHTAVWTGSEMIVWGGIGAGDLDLGTGGRYNPGFDSWTATSTDAGVPSPRFLHTAVWTGKGMIVWGGGSSLDPSNQIPQFRVNSGGRYDPRTDRWTPTNNTPALGAPSARYGHTAVWSGEEMLVWGGNDGVLDVATGGRYTPSDNTWAPIGVGAGVPAGRSFHTAVWLEGEMIVWGGRNDFDQLNSGARYLPASDGWEPVNGTDPDLPSPRVAHAAVALDPDMLVWGGSPVTATGGRYCGTPTCPVTLLLFVALNRASVLDTLRAFRDGVLARSAEGRELTREFYAHAAEVSLLLASNPDLLARARELLLEQLPRVTALMRGEAVTLDAASARAIEGLLADLQALAGSEGLRRSLARHRADLRGGRLPALPGLSLDLAASEADWRRAPEVARP